MTSLNEWLSDLIPLHLLTTPIRAATSGVPAKGERICANPIALASCNLGPAMIRPHDPHSLASPRAAGRTDGFPNASRLYRWLRIFCTQSPSRLYRFRRRFRRRFCARSFLGQALGNVRPLRLDVNGVERLTGGHEEAIAFLAAETDVGADFREQDHPNALAFG